MAARACPATEPDDPPGLRSLSDTARFPAAGERTTLATLPFRAPSCPRPMKPASILAALLLALALGATDATAQLRSLALVSDNDAYDFWIPMQVRPDREYTNGLEVAAELGGAPLWGRLFGARKPCAGTGPACLSTELRAGQKIFTPAVDAPVLVPGHRPYAGWLYLAAAGSSEGVRTRRTAGVEVGVTGPPSQGEWVQTTFHRIAGFHEPLGWKGQLRAEPGVVLRYGEEWIAVEARPAGIRVAEVAPHWGAALGNVRTGAHAGVRFRAGYAVPRRWGGPPARHTPASVYLLGGARAELVLRDLFLDGNTFRESPRVERRPAIGELEGGAGVRVGPLGVEYRATSRTRSYATEQEGHEYGSFTVTLHTHR